MDQVDAIWTHFLERHDHTSGHELQNRVKEPTWDKPLDTSGLGQSCANSGIGENTGKLYTAEKPENIYQKIAFFLR